MTGLLRATLIIICLLSPLLAAADEAQPSRSDNDGWAIDSWSVQISLYTHHFDPSPEHVNQQDLLGLEAHFANRWLAGGAAFKNSFGQSSQYVYFGRTWPIWGSEHWYAKLTGGLLHGYKEPYENKIPFNGLGISPAVVPSLGFRYKLFVTEAHLGGVAVFTITAGVRF